MTNSKTLAHHDPMPPALGDGISSPRSRAASLARRFLGFGVLPIASMVGSVMLIPLITRLAGPEGWGSIATGQAMGVVGATLVQFGWLVVGPPKVATVGLRAARGVYFTSALMRLVLYVVTLPLLLVLTASLTTPEWTLPAVALCAAVGLSGLSSSWFYVGRGDPLGLLRLEVGPRLAGTALSAVALLAGADVLAYVAITLTTEVIIVVAVMIVNARPDQPLKAHVQLARTATKDQWGLAFSALLSLGYQRAAIPIVAGANLLAAPLYAVGDRSQAYARLPFVPVAQSLQQWVYEGGADERADSRAKVASGAVISISGLVAFALYFALPPLSAAFFGERLALGPAATAPICVSVVAVGASLAFSTFILVPRGAIRVITWSGVAASLVAAPSIWFAARGGGAPEALWAVAGAEAGVAIIQACAAVRLMGHRRS